MVKKSLVAVVAVMLGVPALADAAAVDRGTARAALTRMEQASLQVTNLVNSAKAENDAIKFSCLNDKATQIKTFVGAASSTFGSAEGLQGASRSDAFAAIVADADTVEALREEAARCVGTAEAEEAEEKTDDAVAGNTPDRFDALDPNGTASALGHSNAPALPAVQAPGAASPTK